MDATRRQSLAAHAGLVLFGIVLGAGLLAAGEALLRWVNPRTLERVALDDLPFLHSFSPVYGWAPRPSFHYVFGGHETTTNRLGYRGPEIPLARTPGKKRVLMIGDSITFGFGVGDEETFSRVLERLDPRLEVVNFGVQGYGTDQELLKLEREGIAYQPDVVVLNFCVANDFLDNAADRAIYDGLSPKPYFVLEGGRLQLRDQHLRLSRFQSAMIALKEHSFLFDAAMRLAGRTAKARTGPLVPVEPAFDLTFALIRRMDEVARARGSRLLVVLYPSLREFEKPSRRVRLFFESEALAGIPRFDLLPRFKARGTILESFDRFALDGTFHLTVEGHRAAAEILRDILREQGILD